MNRLTSGTASLVALLVVSGCNNDPTENLRNGITSIQAAPTTLSVVVGKTKKVQVTALDEQGNPLEEAYEVTSVGPGITVTRDSTFFPVFINDTLLTVPPTAPTFQFNVTGTDLVATSFVVSAADKSVEIPVLVAADPTTVPVSIVTSTGPSASDQTVITAPAPYIFAPDATVTFDAGAAVVLSVADDGTTITILPPPGATSKGIITGLILPHLPQAPLTDSTDVALAISPSVPPQPGTDDPATAPDITGVAAFYDGAAFGSVICGVANDGAPCQLYKITLAEDGAFDASLAWSNTTDLGLYVLSADGTADTGQSCDDLGNAEDGGAEACTITLPAGEYRIAIVNFGPFYDPVDPPPDWISLAITPQ